MTNFGAASVENFLKLTTFWFEWDEPAYRNVSEFEHFAVMPHASSDQTVMQYHNGMTACVWVQGSDIET